MGSALPLLLLCLQVETAAGSPIPPAAPRTKLGPLADRPRSGGKVSLRLPPPTVRIGLSGDGRSVPLASSGGLYIVDRDTGRDVWKHLHQGAVRVVLDRGGAPEPQPIFRVQVASLASQEEAEGLRARIEADTGEVVQVARNPDRNAWRVRVGERASRDEIRLVEDKLRTLGFEEIWVTQEAVAGGREPKLRLVDEGYNDMLTSSKALVVLPSAEGRPIKVGDQPYRGVIEVRVTRGRELQIVNMLNIEDYLKGVVPRELGPSAFPELEALKAQAVAARTYMEANRGQFSEEGFDICDTARCQVYGGIQAEHPLSDFAVEQTAGLIATWEGRPINALYTSTCGGHTEDLRNVFAEMQGPYLKGVECYPDESTLAASRRVVTGAWKGPAALLPGGERLDDGLALLEVLGVLAPAEATAEKMAKFADAEEVGRWTAATLKTIGKAAPAGLDLSRDIRDAGALADFLVAAFGWQERIGLLADPRDLPAYLDPVALEATAEAFRPALAFLVKEGILPRMAGRDPAGRALVARALHRMVLRYDAAGLIAGRYRGSHGAQVGLESEGTLAFHSIAARLHILIRRDDVAIPVASQLLQDGDALEYHLSASGDIDYLSIKANERSASDDRFSNVYVWEVRMPREELESRIRSRASIGRLIDLLPGHRGASGRLLDLTVQGSAGRLTFHGFNIERLLGLRETLFLIDRQRGADGAIETFIFSGKGWGHGVGLCQIGAYGMALRGKSFEEIIHHYYTGVTLEKLAPR